MGVLIALDFETPSGLVCARCWPI